MANLLGKMFVGSLVVMGQKARQFFQQQVFIDVAYCHA